MITSLLTAYALYPLATVFQPGLTSPLDSIPREMNVELRFRNIECHATTEASHDEIFILMTLIRPNKAPVTIPIPNDTFKGDADDGRSLDFNDSGDKALRYFGSNPVVSEPLERVGDKMMAVFTFWEDDLDWGGWFIKNLPKITAAVTSAIDPAAIPEAKGIAEKVQAAIKSLNIDTHPHDYIGSYGIELKWTGAAETVNALSFGPDTVKHGPGMRDARGSSTSLGTEWEYFKVKMTGSGSIYVVETYLRMQVRGQ